MSRRADAAAVRTAIVLAGGHSRRFGGDKLTYPVGGQPVLERTVAAVGRIAPEIVVGVDSTRRLKTLSGLLPGGTRFVRDRRSLAVRGPGGALASCLPRVPRAATIVVAGDMPWLEPSALEALARKVPRMAGGLAVPLRPSGAVEALVQAYRHPPVARRLGLLLSGRGSRLRPMDFLRLSPALVLVPAARLSVNRRCFLSVNTPADVRRRPTRLRLGAKEREIRVPPAAARWFRRALYAVAHANLAAAAEAFAREARVYQSAGVTHLELHALADVSWARRAIRRRATDGESRIRAIRSALGSLEDGARAGAPRRTRSGRSAGRP